MDLQKEEWSLWGRWIQPTLSGAFWPSWYQAKSLREILPATTLHPILFFDGHTFLAQEDLNACDEVIAKYYAEGSLGELDKKLEAVGSSCEKRLLELLDKKEALGTAEYVEELCGSYAEMVGVWVIATFMSQALEKLVREKGLAASDADIVQNIGAHARPTWLEQQNKEIKSIAQDLLAKDPALTAGAISATVFENHPDVRERLAKHLREFEWFGTHHWVGEPYTLEKVYKDIEDLLKKEVEPLSAPVALATDDNEDLWKLMAGFMYWRTHAAEATAKVVYESRSILTKLAKGWGMTYGELVYLSSQELIKAAQKSLANIDLPENFKERTVAYGAYIDDTKEEIVVAGAALEELVAQVVDTVSGDITRLTGTVASRGGVVRGRAKVILAPHDVSKFEEGDILVASETTPDFVPLMKKALAIVTETGGITSHAAIVSRELKKPCVIGTKIATQVIKDGDLVEVDAENGIITILQKASN
jgi:phosphohistidine swiveling domain-containing protein